MFLHINSLFSYKIGVVYVEVSEMSRYLFDRIIFLK